MSSIPLDIKKEEIQLDPKIADKDLICELRKVPSVLYGIFVEVVRQYYANDHRMLIGTPLVRWDANPQKTEIWIDTELRWEDEHPEFRPAIYVKLDQIAYQPRINIGRSYSMNLKDGEYTYDRLGKGTVSFVHLASTAGEACALCDDTSVYLSTFAKQIEEDFCFTLFQEDGRQPLSQSRKESKEKYMSLTSFSFEFGESWTIKQESPILKEVNISSLQRYEYSGIVSSEKEIQSL